MQEQLKYGFDRNNSSGCFWSSQMGVLYQLSANQNQIFFKVLAA